MKKLTAGIFTVLMGLVSVNAADAAVASKAYVDAKATAEASAAQTAAENALSSAKSELEGKINAKVAQTDYNAKIQELEAADATFATTSAMNTELAKKQNNLTVTGGILTWDAGTSTLGLEGIASDSSVTELKGTVDTLNGSATTEGSVKKQIADAIADEVERADDAYDAKGAAADALQAAKDYANENDADTIYDDREVRGLISDAQATADAAVAKEQVGIGENFAISDECKAADAVCSLVVRAGVAGWEKIRY